MRARSLGALVAATSALAAGVCPAAPGTVDLDRLLELSLEELGKIPVVSASLHAEPLSEVPASVFVIRGETIRASGARSIAEALELAPNLHVARSDARGYAVSARGLKTSLSNKLLVLIDGRPVYTSLFSGVLWDQQDTLLEDIARIEVISGPGAAAWGTNAVHGVINVITRSASETLGGHAGVFAGASGHGASVRQGWELGDAGAMRVYAKRIDLDSTDTATGAAVGDGWTQSQVGFRSDWTLDYGALQLQGDAFRARSDPRPLGAVEVSGFNALAHWQQALGDGSTLAVQGFVDVVDRDDPLVLLDRIEMLDLEVQHTRWIGEHMLIVGGGYRRADDESRPGALARLLPADATLEWGNVFVEDNFALTEALQVDLGLRLESNSYTGVEVLPSARLAWQVSDAALLWASASRAVRAPARFDRAFFFPASEPFLIRGGPEFRSEVARVAELGLRAQPTATLSISATLFHHWYDGLRAGRPAEAGGVVISNGVEGTSYGLEAWSTLRFASEWEIGVGLLEQRHDLRLAEGFADSNAIRDQGNDPEHQAMVRVIRNLPHDQQLFVLARHVSALPHPHVPAYTSLDARWSWSPTPRLELGVAAENLLDDAHAEFAPRAGFAQSVFGRSLALDLRIAW